MPPLGTIPICRICEIGISLSHPAIDRDQPYPQHENTFQTSLRSRAACCHRTVQLYGCTVPSMAWMYPSMAVYDTAVCCIGLYKNGHYGHITAIHLSPTTCNRNPLALTWLSSEL